MKKKPATSRAQAGPTQAARPTSIGSKSLPTSSGMGGALDGIVDHRNHGTSAPDQNAVCDFDAGLALS